MTKRLALSALGGIALLLSLACHALAQQPSTPPTIVSAVQIGGDVSNNTAKSSSGTTAITNASRFASWQPLIAEFGAACNGTTDDSLAAALAIRTLNGTGVNTVIPETCQVSMGSAARLNGGVPQMDHTGFIGQGGRDTQAGSGPNGIRGSAFILRDTGGPAFIVNTNVQFAQLTFYWPGITEAATSANGGVPPTYPPMMEGSGTAAGATQAGAQVVGLRFHDNEVMNAPTVLDTHLDPAGGNYIYNNLAFATSTFWNVGQMAQESFVYDNDFTPGAYQSLGSASTHTLAAYAAGNASVILGSGNGTASAASTTSTQGLIFHHNYVFGLYSGLHVLGGWLDLLDATDNQFDEVTRALFVDTGGLVDGRWDGGSITASQYNGSTGPSTTVVATPFYFASTMANNLPQTIDIDHVRIASSTGPFLDMELSSGASYVVVTNPDWGAGASVSGQDAIVWKSPSRPDIEGGQISMAGSSSSSNSCFNLAGNVQTIKLVNITFISCGNVISFTGGTAGSGMIAGNISVGTRTAIFGSTGFPQYAASLAPMNAWDIATPYANLAARTDGALIVKAGGNAVASIAESGAIKSASTVTPSTTP